MNDSTVVILNADSLPVPLDSLPGDVRTLIEQQLPNTRSTQTDNIPWAAFSVLSFFFIVAVIRIRKVLRQPDAQTAYSPVTTQAGSYNYDGATLNFPDDELNGILQKRFYYYQNLSVSNKALFIQRIQSFIATKTFCLPAEDTFKEVPVLLSATAVQLLFGLDDCTLSWFTLFNVSSEPYFANDPHALRVLAGNVEGTTINIAWSNFLSGIYNAEDGVNVGIHELAHALYYQYIIADNCADKTFATRFNMVMQEVEKVFERGYADQDIFSSYAFKNQQEFWAESAEVFFERSEEMQHHFPFLYNDLCTLLNQDPLQKSSPVNRT